MVLGSIISALFFASFAYIILILANKESGNMKLGGQILAVLIGLVALSVLILGSMGWGGGMGGCPMMGGMTGKCPISGGMMGENGMMMKGMGETPSKAFMKMMESNPSMMDDMMKDKSFRAMMQKKMMNSK